MNALAAPLSVLALFGLPLPAAAAHPACQPDAAVEPVIDAAGSRQGMLDLSPEEWEERVELVEAALADHPGEVNLHRTRQFLYSLGPREAAGETEEALLEEYAALRAKHPDDPRYHYLHGRLARDLDVERDAFAASLEADPDFPWAHLGMTVVYLRDQASAKRTEEEAEEAGRRAAHHLERFHELCPDRVEEVLTYSRSIGEPDWWGERVPAFRGALLADPETHLHAFPYLWALEFRLADPSDHARIRERIAEDLAVLGSLGAGDEEVLEVLREGYELAGMVERSVEIEARLREADPCSMESVRTTMNEWYEEHLPTGDRSEAEERELALAHEEITRQWVERCPDAYLFWSARLRALAHLDTAPAAEILAAGERAAELYGRWRGHSSPSGYTQAAEAFIDRGLALDRALALLERAESEVMERREEQDRFLDDLPEEQLRQIERGNAYGDWGRHLLVARARIGLGEVDAARAELADLGARLDSLDPGEEAEGREGLAHSGYESAYWEARAELAEAEERTADAVAFLLRAAAVKPGDARPWLAGPDPEEAEARAVALWSDLGGTPAGLAALEESATAGSAAVAAIADASAWVEASEALPDFELADVSGSVWTLEELRGKTVFANAWATWCGPCRQELPAVQALHERLADREDVVVVTLNMDSNPGVIAPYLEREGFTFPTLLAYDYLTEEAEVFAIPRSWIVDPGGTVRYEQSGFDASIPEEEWLDEVEERLGEAREAGER